MSRHGQGARSLGVVTAVVAMLAGSCTGTPAPLPPKPPVVNVSMAEYSFQYNGVIPRGRVVFTVTNAGHEDHKLTLVYLPDDVPPILDQLRGDERRVVDPLAGTVPRPPGSRETFAADLSAGRWAFICFILLPDGKTHGALGMASEFRVA